MRFFQLDEALDEYSSRRNSVCSAAFSNGGAVEDGMRVREAMETHAVLILRVSECTEPINDVRPTDPGYMRGLNFLGPTIPDLTWVVTYTAL